MPFLLRFSTRLLFGVCLIVLANGCGSGALSTANPGVEPPHEGALIRLPGGKGYVEVVKKTGTAPITAEVSFYLYRDASYTPYDSIPESAALVLDGKRSINLKAEDDALVTPEGPVLFGKRDVQGLLRFDIDGDTIQVVLGGR